MGTERFNTSALGTCLKELRVKQGLSQKDIQSVFGWGSSQFISNWERGISVPPAHTVSTLCELYKVPRQVLVARIKDAYIRTAADKIDRLYGEVG